MTPGKAQLGVDTGGTFTDFVSRDGRIIKVPTDPGHPGRVLELGASGVLAGVSLKGERLVVAHGTTVVTNALLTDNLARTGILVTRGFRDLLTLGRQNRPILYALHPKPEHAAPSRRMCAEVAERIDARGGVVEELDPDEVLAAVRRLKRLGAATIVICFLHSYRNPRHERKAAQIVKKEGLPVTLSSELVPEFREYERFSTALANAGLMPMLNSYVSDLDKRGRALSRALGSGNRPKVLVMQSSGGMIGTRQAAKEPIRLVLSGPAGGVVGAWRSAGGRRRPRLITLDMGGTSTDVSLLDGGEARVTRCRIAGRPLVVPAIDIHTVGAGGGSIARRDRGGALRVGPESAGAVPGPASYGCGGPATVTDAHVFLGRIPAGRFLGGNFDLHQDACTRAVEDLAKELGLGSEETALGIVRVAEATMERALRTISLERGHDPRRFSLVAFGGAGALHAVALARSLGMSEVVIPPDPGLLSAHGMLDARIVKEYSRTVLGTRLAEVEAEPERSFGSLLKKGLRAMKSDGVAADTALVEYFADLRYEGQSHELTVPFRGASDGRTGGTRRAFESAHRNRYGFVMEDRAVELVNVRLRLLGPRSSRRRRSPGTRKRLKALARVSVGFDEGRRETPVYAREDMGAGTAGRGPAIITEYSATTLVSPGVRFAVEKDGCLVLRTTGEGRT